MATRRLRAFLRAGRELLDPAWGEGLRTELRWLGGELGPSRDLDVMIAHLRDEAEALGDDAQSGRALVALLERDREGLGNAVRDALSSDRYFAILDRLEQPPPLIEADVTLKQIQSGEHARLAKAMAKLDQTAPDEKLHRARIKAKRARYAAELRGDDAYVKEAKRLQDVLGEHQDAVVAQEQLRALAAREPSAAMAAGRLIERERARAEARRRAWPAAWKRVGDAA